MSDDQDLIISRFLAAPRAKIWRAWSDPKNLAAWWCPKPWVTDVRAFDFRPGGDLYTFMHGPDGKGGEGESDNPGCFLEIVPNRTHRVHHHNARRLAADRFLDADHGDLCDAR